MVLPKNMQIYLSKLYKTSVLVALGFGKDKCRRDDWDEEVITKSVNSVDR